MARTGQIGKVLADLDAEIKQLVYAQDVLANETAEGLASKLAQAQHTRAFIFARASQPTNGDTPKRERKPKAKKEKPA